MWQWSVDRKYPSEDLPWVEHSWSLDSTEECNTVGYTLRSLPSGPRRIYDNLYDVLMNRDKTIITLAEIRKQVSILEESHNQNALPTREQDL